MNVNSPQKVSLSTFLEDPLKQLEVAFLKYSTSFDRRNFIWKIFLIFCAGVIVVIV